MGHRPPLCEHARLTSADLRGSSGREYLVLGGPSLYATSYLRSRALGSLARAGGTQGGSVRGGASTPIVRACQADQC